MVARASCDPRLDRDAQRRRRGRSADPLRHGPDAAASVSLRLADPGDAGPLGRHRRHRRDSGRDEPRGPGRGRRLHPAHPRRRARVGDRLRAHPHFGDHPAPARARARTARTARRLMPIPQILGIGLLGARRLQDRPARASSRARSTGAGSSSCSSPRRSRSSTTSTPTETWARSCGQCLSPRCIARPSSSRRSCRCRSSRVCRTRIRTTTTRADGRRQAARAGAGGRHARPRPLHRPPRHDPGKGDPARRPSSEACEDGLNFCVSVFAIDHTGVMPDGTGIRDEVNFRDMQVVADLETLRIVPWERETAICLADCRLDGEPLETDPRNILRRAIAAAEAQGPARSPSATSSSSSSCAGRPEGALQPYQPTPGLVYRMDARTDPAGVVREMEDNVRGLGPSLHLREPRVRPVAVGDQHALRGRARRRPTRRTC